MRFLKLFLLTVLMWSSASSLFAVSYPSDNFDDNSLNTNKWGDSQWFDETTAYLTETNSHLSFTGSAASNVTVIIPWTANLSTYTQNWEAAVDINIGDIEIATSSGMQVFMAIVNADDYTFGDRMTVAMSLEKDQSGISVHGFEADSAVAGTEIKEAPVYGYVSTTNRQGRLRMAFNASTKVLTASYNGVPFAEMDVDDLETDWGMTGTSGFMFALGGSMWCDGGVGFTNSTDSAYADNFIVRSGENLTYDLYILNGDGSGAYTNGSQVSVTASNAPSGQVFDCWAGSTQYLSSVTSSTATVTMPAQAITIVPVYRLSGTMVGDDFNDNSKDVTKWGDDIHVMSTNTSFYEVNGRLELRKTGGIDGHGVLRPWIGGVGSYTQNWESAVDVHLGNVVLANPGAWVNINLAVANMQDTNLVYGVPIGDGFDIALDLYRDNNGIQRGWEMTSRVNGQDLATAPNYGYTATAVLDGRVKISFDASDKVLTASYNGNVIGWIDVDDPSTSWDMDSSSTFGVVIAGSTGTEAINVAEGDVYADNFSVTGTVIPSEDGDADGLPDSWEQQYFGSTGVSPASICSNGVNTVLEAYVAGFNPNESSQRFGITGGDVRTRTLMWNAVSGRLYNIYYTTNLLNGFQPLMTNYAGGSVTDTLRSAESKCFYKIDVRLAP